MIYCIIYSVYGMKLYMGCSGIWDGVKIFELPILFFEKTSLLSENISRASFILKVSAKRLLRDRHDFTVFARHPGDFWI